MIIGQIKDGIVLDHITAGKAMSIYNVLKLDELDCTVAMIKNADSTKLGKKDIIKISTLLDLDLDILGYLDPGITVNVIRDNVVAERRKVALPERVVGVIKCKNPPLHHFRGAGNCARVQADRPQQEGLPLHLLRARSKEEVIIKHRSRL